MRAKAPAVQVLRTYGSGTSHDPQRLSEHSGLRAALVASVVLLVTAPVSQAQVSATVNLNNGNCSPREGLLDPCNVVDPSFASATYGFAGIDHAMASAEVMSGVLRARTESIDLDTRVPDARTVAAAPCPPDPAPEDPPCSDNWYLYLESPGGNLPELAVLDRVDVTGFSNVLNNVSFLVEEVVTPNVSYLLRTLYKTNVGDPESGVPIEVTRNEEIDPLASAQIEQLVLTYTDDNPYEIEAGKVGISFEVDYSRVDLPAAGIEFDVQNNVFVLLSLRLDLAGGGSTNFVGSIGHSSTIDANIGEIIESESLSPGAALNVQFVETERSTTRFSGRLETTAPISLDTGDTLTVVNAFFRVGSGADLVEDDPEPAPVPVSISDGATTAHLYGDFPPGLVTDPSEPIAWPSQPPSGEPPLFADDFEAGDLDAWSSRKPPP